MILKNLKRNRCWMGTIWEEADLEILKKMNFDYLIISDKDYTKDDKKLLHWHVLICFKNARQRPLKTNNAHWDSVRDRIAAKDYCISKGKNFLEFGNLNINPANKNDWKGFVEECKTESLENLINGPFSNMYARYMSFAGIVHNVFKKIEILKELDNLWIYGKPGTGKTSFVWKEFKNLYVKPQNKWWDGYNEEENVLIDDWGKDTSTYLFDYLKIWADYYPFRCEMKGTSRMIRPKRILITSNYSIEEAMKDWDRIEPIRRRFKIMNFKELGKIPDKEIPEEFKYQYEMNKIQTKEEEEESDSILNDD